MTGQSNQFPLVTLFTNQWLTLGFYFGAIVVILGIAEFTRRYFAWRGEESRKIVHVAVGVLIFTARFLFAAPGPAIILAVVFILANIFALKYKLFPGIHMTLRESLGTVFYPSAFLFLVLIYWYRDPAVLLVGIAVMAFADPLAAQVGESVPHPHTYHLWSDRKSLEGSLALAFAAFVLTLTGLLFLTPLSGEPPLPLFYIIPVSLAVSVIAVVTEGLSSTGSDNLTLPLGVAFSLDIMLHSQREAHHSFLLWLILAFALAYGAYRIRILTKDGTAAAFLLGTFVFGIGGVQWMIPLGTFFVLSSLLSKLGKTKKRALETVYEKPGNRDMMQVLANGGVAGIIAVLWHFSQADILYYSFLGSLAAATADTWATEIGVFARRQPRSILTLRPVAMGTSGGITPLGTTGAAIGALILALSGWIVPFGAIEPFFHGNIVIAIIAAGILGAMFDSLLGATVQAQYQCRSCGQTTENTIHCGSSANTRLSRGVRWINNDVVNLACTSTGALLVYILLYPG